MTTDLYRDNHNTIVDVSGYGIYIPYGTKTGRLLQVYIHTSPLMIRASTCDTCISIDMVHPPFRPLITAAAKRHGVQLSTEKNINK